MRSFFYVLFSFLFSAICNAKSEYIVVYAIPNQNGVVVNGYAAFTIEDVKTFCDSEKKEIKSVRIVKKIKSELKSHEKNKNEINKIYLDMRVVVEIYAKNDVLIDAFGMDGIGRIQYKNKRYVKNVNLMDIINSQLEEFKFVE